MSKRVKTTKIEKKYKDKKTGEEKKISMDYSKVVDRIAEFRKDNPRGLIDTSFTITDGQLIFKTRILKDKSDQNSAEATGHALAKYDADSEKQFEKLETISVGRALAMLGYAASGEVASFEEMEEFAAYRDNKIEELIVGMQDCSDINELRTYFMGLGSYMAESRIIEAKDKRKAELNENSRPEAK
jgi:hypothetical protein